MPKILVLHHFYHPDDVAPILVIGMGTPKAHASAGGLRLRQGYAGQVGIGKRHQVVEGGRHA